MLEKLRDIRHLLYTSAYYPKEIERVLDPKKPCFIKFDPVLGYVLKDYIFKDGIDDSWSSYVYEKKGGHRKVFHYANQHCRINTYGDSYTQCAQVSDGETWQEILAAHFREPIRNFGVGGYGVYQAYLRARRVEENKSLAAEYIILNIWDDDYLRNLDAARWIRVGWMCRDLPRGRKDTYPVHGFPWAHLRFNPKKGNFVELPGLLKKDSDLWKLVGKENYYQAFKDDQVANLYCLTQGGEIEGEHLRELEELAEAFKLKLNLRDRKTRQSDAMKLHQVYGQRSTMYVVDKFRKWTRANSRKLMILLSYDVPTVQNYLRTGERFDTEFLEFLKRENYTFVDTLEKMRQEFKCFRGSINQFCERFYVSRAGAQVFGHFNPFGNFWFAFAIRKELLNWLSPPPPAYQG
ncbi:MAG: hypothetical protein NC911_03360 [Candidatus Omnitrophica bacterium]|nr:hypothetical protein [Candidatus Omnitrophota bacterium]MCM8768707.1 hypothetical protein [Candidatus Omnitrophota bacterium]